MQWSNDLANKQSWPSSISNHEMKLEIAKKLVSFVKNGQVIGVGSGTTSFITLQELAKKQKSENLDIRVIPTSKEIAQYSLGFGLSVSSIDQLKPDWYFDGADEILSQSLIKGRGGAMYQEKLLMKSADKSYILVDQTKYVEKLGQKFPIPVEVEFQSIHYVENALKQIGAQHVEIRIAGKGKDGPAISENGCYILDASFNNVEDGLEKEIKSITGVLESGLFQNYDFEVLTN